MMKIKKNSINKLKIEIKDLEDQITSAVKNNKTAFAKRLILIKEMKTNLLNSWVDSS